MCLKERQARYRQKLKVRAFDLIGRKCVFCPVTEKLHAAHVIPTKLRGPGRGMRDRFEDVIKNPRSYRPMCPPCHRTYDALVALVRAEVCEPVYEEPIPMGDERWEA